MSRASHDGPLQATRAHVIDSDQLEAILAYLFSQRERMQTRVAMLRSGRAWTSEMHEGAPADTTAHTLRALEDNLEEIDQLLTMARVSHDA